MTPEQDETLEKLRVAIQNHLTEMGWLEDKILIEFVVVSCAMPSQGDDGHTYYLTDDSGTKPFHHTVGLLHAGLKWHYEEHEQDIDGSSG